MRKLKSGRLVCSELRSPQLWWPCLQFWWTSLLCSSTHSIQKICPAETSGDSPSKRITRTVGMLNILVMRTTWKSQMTLYTSMWFFFQISKLQLKTDLSRVCLTLAIHKDATDIFPARGSKPRIWKSYPQSKICATFFSFVSVCQLSSENLSASIMTCVCQNIASLLSNWWILCTL